MKNINILELSILVRISSTFFFLFNLIIKMVDCNHMFSKWIFNRSNFLRWFPPMNAFFFDSIMLNNKSRSFFFIKSPFNKNLKELCNLGTFSSFNRIRGWSRNTYDFIEGLIIIWFSIIIDMLLLVRLRLPLSLIIRCENYNKWNSNVNIITKKA